MLSETIDTRNLPGCGRSSLVDGIVRAKIAGMTTETLHKVHTARPFIPFYIRRGDGLRLPVKHPEMLAYSPKSRIAVVYLDDGSFEHVDLLPVTGLEVMANGHKSKK
jgi:hypothetical protein